MLNRYLIDIINKYLPVYYYTVEFSNVSYKFYDSNEIKPFIYSTINKNHSNNIYDIKNIHELDELNYDFLNGFIANIQVYSDIDTFYYYTYFIKSYKYDTFHFNDNINTNYEKIKRAITLLSNLCKKNKIAEHHGLKHALSVMNHVKKAIKYEKDDINKQDQLIILLTALLHDADDPKIFNTENNSNARTILNQLDLGSETINLIIELINLVSVRNNGDYIPKDLKPYYLYPRYADRLEAIGKIGVKRCYEYALDVNNPLYTKDTLKAKNKKELYEIATKERYNDYISGKIKSESMIDHYYDKLLHIDFKCDNEYLTRILSERKQIMEKVCFMYGQGKLEEYLNRL